MLPNSKTGLAALEAKIATTDLSELLKRTGSTEIKLSLPKFKLETSLKLNPILCKVKTFLTFENFR